MITFAHAFDMAYKITYNLQAMTGQIIPLVMFTESLSLFDILTKVSVTTEKCLLIDLKAVKNSYNRMDLQDVAYVRSEHNGADALTNIKKNSILIEGIIGARLVHPI